MSCGVLFLTEHLYIRSFSRDHGWFFKPQLFPIKVILWKRRTLQLSNATNFSSIRQKTAKLQEFKVERLEEQFVTVTMGKSRFDGTERPTFPPWQRFICIHSDLPMPEIDEGWFASFSVQIFTCTMRCLCFLCSDTRRRSRVLKDNDWRDVTRIFQMGELRGSECSCFPPT